MADGAEPRTARYSAFISYSRVDAAAARRIHRQLESYHLPQRLHPDNDAWNPRTRRLNPVFLDRDEMGVAPDLEEALNEALREAHFLIVLCTPASARSEWVGREIEMFRALRGDRAILAALVAGTAENAFHPALKHHARADGHLVNPLAADFQASGDGERLALLKLIAVMAGVGLGDLVQRDAQRRTRRLLVTLAATALVLAALAALAFVAWKSREDAARQSARVGAMSSYMLDDLRNNLKRYGNLGMLAEVNRGVMETFRGRDLAGLSDGELRQLAKLRQAMSDDAQQRGDLAEATRQAVEASRLTSARLLARPDDAQRIFDHAQSQYYVGLADWNAGDWQGTGRAYNAYLDLAQRLVRLDPENPDWWLEKGYAETNLGMYTLRSRIDIATAEAHLRSGLQAYQNAGRLRPGDRNASLGIIDDYAWLGDTLRLKQDYAGARSARAAQRRMLETLQRADPRDRQVQIDLVANRLAEARILAAEQRWSEALAELETGRSEAVVLQQLDPMNVWRQAQVRIFDLFKLRTWLSMPVGSRPPAEALAAANGQCERDLIALKNVELAEFCSILEARRTGSSALVIVDKPRTGLSVNWGLDFVEERRLSR